MSTIWNASFANGTMLRSFALSTRAANIWPPAARMHFFQDHSSEASTPLLVSHLQPPHQPKPSMQPQPLTQRQSPLVVQLMSLQEELETIRALPLDWKAKISNLLGHVSYRLGKIIQEHQKNAQPENDPDPSKAIAREAPKAKEAPQVPKTQQAARSEHLTSQRPANNNVLEPAKAAAIIPRAHQASTFPTKPLQRASTPVTQTVQQSLSSSARPTLSAEKDPLQPGHEPLAAHDAPPRPPFTETVSAFPTISLSDARGPAKAWRKDRAAIRHKAITRRMFEHELALYLLTRNPKWSVSDLARPLGAVNPQTALGASKGEHWHHCVVVGGHVHFLEVCDSVHKGTLNELVKRKRQTEASWRERYECNMVDRGEDSNGDTLHFWLASDSWTHGEATVDQVTEAGFNIITTLGKSVAVIDGAPAFDLHVL